MVFPVEEREKGTQNFTVTTVALKLKLLQLLLRLFFTDNLLYILVGEVQINQVQCYMREFTRVDHGVHHFFVQIVSYIVTLVYI